MRSGQIIVLLFIFIDLVKSFVNYSELKKEQSAVDAYQLRTNTVFGAEKFEKQVSKNNLDSFGRVPYDPYYIGVKVFQDYEDEEEENLSFEEQLREFFGQDFFENRKYVLFTIFCLIIFLVVVSCLSVCCCWMCKIQRRTPPPPPSRPPTSQATTSPLYPRSIDLYNSVPLDVESQSFLRVKVLPTHTLYPVIEEEDESPPEYFSLQGRKLYPGIL